jgi:hypothetical protein
VIVHYATKSARQWSLRRLLRVSLADDGSIRRFSDQPQSTPGGYFTYMLMFDREVLDAVPEADA